MKTDRLFQIIYILLERKSVTAPELATTLGVSVRTIFRDIETLSLSGVPIYASSGKGGGISLMQEFTFDKALLSEDEQNQILFSLQSLQVAGQQTGPLLHKLGAVFQKQNTNWIEVDFSRWGYGQVDTKKFELIKTAILQKWVLDILYCNTSGITLQRKIKPFKLIFKDKNWYLQAFCLQQEDFRLFKISRIQNLHLTGTHFTETFTDAPPLEFGTVKDNLAIAVKLRFSPNLAYRIYDEFECDSIKKEKEGTFLVTAKFPNGMWVINYLFSYGTELEILEPEYLRLELAEYAKKLYMHFKT
ncbi:YafY family protein [uncultured Sphaerochaeta sp.]|uniref:helix-turn-helix transcriptional regulator n=1 Tax=uncultured Sphaerochaeta sp. TaxID=886478 RepID=UPI002A0A3D26|nr:YafY family protein [uncultured Sphaerochaeta sp.]